MADLVEAINIVSQGKNIHMVIGFIAQEVCRVLTGTLENTLTQYVVTHNVPKSWLDPCYLFNRKFFPPK